MALSDDLRGGLSDTADLGRGLFDTMNMGRGSSDALDLREVCLIMYSCRTQRGWVDLSDDLVHLRGS